MDADIAQTETPVSILLVDDRRENLLSLEAILSSPQYRLVEASSGAEALRRLLDEDYAVILLDVVMPGMDGFELAAAIKQRERTAAVPIVFLTGVATDVTQIYGGYSVGAVDYLVKPLVPEMVRAKVAVFADLYRQRRRIEQQARRLVEAERNESELELANLRLSAERHYRSLAEAMPHIIWTARPNGTIDYLNQRWFEYTGVSAEQARGSWRQVIHPDDIGAMETGWNDALRTGRMFLAECRMRRAADGTFRWHLCRAVPEQGETGQIIAWLGTFTDIEDQKRAQAVLAEFKSMFDNVLEAVLIFEPRSWRTLYVNRGAEILLGYAEQELLRMRPFDFMVDGDRVRPLMNQLREGAKGAVTVETRCRRKNAREIQVEFSFQFIRVNGGQVVSIARDVSKRKEVEAKLEEEAHTDALTGCANRRWFTELARHEMARTRRHHGEMALLMLDLDHFKAINDQYGHPTGDTVLKKTVEVCHGILREEDAVGRIGGEEFAILLPDTDSRRAMEVGERVRQAVAASEVPLEGVAPIRFTTSVGVTDLRPGDRDTESLLARADHALYSAKESGRNRVCSA